MGKKLAIGLLVAGLVAVAGYFGFRTYSQQAAVAEVERAFAEIRARGTSARFSSAALDAVRKGITVSGIEIVSNDKSVTLNVDKVIATGAAPPRDGYVEAEVLDLEGVKLTLSGPPAAGGTLTYLLPKVMVDQYRGPVALLAVPKGMSASTPQGVLNLALRQLAATTMAKITIPKMGARIASATAGVAPLEIAYDGIAAEQVSGGKIRSLIIDRATFSGSAHVFGAADPAALAPPPQGASSPQGAAKDAGRMEGEISSVVAAQIDTRPLLAIVSDTPATPNAGGYEEIYGKVVTGPYRLKYPSGEISSAASLLLEHVGVKPAAFTKARLEALDALSQKGPDLSIAEAGELLERVTDVLEAVTFRTLAMTNATSEGPDDKVEIAAVRFDGFSAGVLDLFEIKGVDGHDADQQPVKMGRLAMRRLDLPAMVRLAEDADPPSLGAVLGLFKVVSSLEASGIEVPYEKADARVGPASIKIGAFNLSWGRFLGELPTTLGFELADATGPISASDGEPFTYLANAGMTRATLGAKLNLAYDADGRFLSLAPAQMKVDKAFSVEINAGVGNLPKEAFTDIGAAVDALAGLNGRPFTVKIENLGLAELMIAQLAAAEDVSPEALRQELLVTIDEQAKEWAETTKDAPAVAEALKAFVMNPKTLTLTATPKTNAPLMPLVMGDDPLTVLQAFDIKVQAGP